MWCPALGQGAGYLTGAQCSGFFFPAAFPVCWSKCHLVCRLAFNEVKNIWGQTGTGALRAVLFQYICTVFVRAVSCSFVVTGAISATCLLPSFLCICTSQNKCLYEISQRGKCADEGQKLDMWLCFLWFMKCVRLLGPNKWKLRWFSLW